MMNEESLRKLCELLELWRDTQTERSDAWIYCVVVLIGVQNTLIAAQLSKIASSH